MDQTTTPDFERGDQLVAYKEEKRAVIVAIRAGYNLEPV